MTNFSLVNIGELTKPATALIEKSSDAVKGALRPRQIRRVGSAETDVEAERIRVLAQAEADASRIQAEGEIEVTDLHRRAFRRSIEEEASYQGNMESILGQAIPQLTGDASPDEVEDDWYTNFYDKCRITSDDEMQNLWARILAGQANNPGTFSRKTVNLVADLDKRDAKLFTNLCRFGWVIGGRVRPLIFDDEHEMYNQHEISFNTIGHLESLSLIHFAGATGFSMVNAPKRLLATYYGRGVVLNLPNDSGNTLSQGKVRLTQWGLELATIVGAVAIDEFFDYVCEKWEKESLI